MATGKKQKTEVVVISQLSLAIVLEDEQMTNDKWRQEETW